MCPFSILAFLQPTTVDKEPIKKGEQYSTVLHDKFVKKKNPAKLIFGRVFGRKLN